ncbi:hypothetical protein BST61_g6306 [Cercospora zeina]
MNSSPYDEGSVPYGGAASQNGGGASQFGGGASQFGGGSQFGGAAQQPYGGASQFGMPPQSGMGMPPQFGMGSIPQQAPQPQPQGQGRAHIEDQWATMSDSQLLRKKKRIFQKYIQFLARLWCFTQFCPPEFMLHRINQLRLECGGQVPVPAEQLRIWIQEIQIMRGIIRQLRGRAGGVGPGGGVGGAGGFEGGGGMPMM